MSVFIALIHNRNAARHSLIYPRLCELSDRVSTFFDTKVELIQIQYQMNIEPLSEERSLQKKTIMRDIEHEWALYRKLPSSPSTEVPTTNLHDRRMGAIQVILADKHIRVWDRFLDSGYDFLVCFEDDALFKNDSINRFKEVLKLCYDQAGSSNLYVDLAGGCYVPDMANEKMKIRETEDYIFYSKPTTNTSCAYLLNRPLAARFKEHITFSPALRLINSDWLLNKLFIDMDNLNQLGDNSLCFHTNPTIFEHGSARGGFPSSIR